MHTISYTKLAALGGLIEGRRRELGWSARKAARQSGMHVRSYLRLEQGEQPRPTTQSLNAVAEAFGVPASDLFGALGWLPDKELPSLMPYLHSKYRDLPPEAVEEMTAYFERLARKYKLSAGPRPGEDEA